MIFSASSGRGRCSAFASSAGARIHTSRSSSVVKITGIAFGWIGFTTAFASVVKKLRPPDASERVCLAQKPKFLAHDHKTCMSGHGSGRGRPSELVGGPGLVCGGSGILQAFTESPSWLADGFGMTFRNFTVFFACPVCGVCYSAVQERSRNVAPKVFLCEDCKSVVCGWSVCYDYTGWQRYDRQAQ
jgi:hypothetical protein